VVATPGQPDPELIPALLAASLEQAAEGYAAMDEWRAVKVLLTV
jgi:hypothetical protein